MTTSKTIITATPNGPRGIDMGPVRILLIAFLVAVGRIALLAQTGSVDTSRKPELSLQSKATLGGHAKEIIDIAFNADGESIATASQDGFVQLWNSRTFEKQAAFSRSGKYSNLAWAPGGRTIAVTRKGRDDNYETEICDTRTGKSVVIIPAGKNFPHSVWSPDGQMILIVDMGRTVKVWNANTGKLISSLEQDPPCAKRSFLESPSKSACSDFNFVSGRFLSDARTVLTTSPASSSKLWDAESGKLKATLDDRESRKFIAMASPDGRVLVVDNAGTVTLLDSTTRSVKLTLKDAGVPQEFSPDSRSLLMGKSSSTDRNGAQIRLLDVSSGDLRTTFDIQVVPWNATAHWSPDGRFIVVSGNGQTQTILVDMRTGQVVVKLPYSGCSPDTWIGSTGCEPFLFTADGLIAMKQVRPLRLFSTDGRSLASVEKASLPADFSPTNASMLVTRGQDKRVAVVWEIVWK
jgi:WD40 repeat protein